MDSWYERCQELFRGLHDLVEKAMSAHCINRKDGREAGCTWCINCQIKKEAHKAQLLINGGL